MGEEGEEKDEQDVQNRRWSWEVHRIKEIRGDGVSESGGKGKKVGGGGR